MLQSYIDAFPLTPLGGVFILAVGLCTMLGAAIPRLRLPLVFIGFAAGLALIWIAMKPLAPGIPPVHRYAVYSLVAAIIVEVFLFATVMPRVRPKGARTANLYSLLIVGFHFLLMTPAFGPLIFLLGLATLANALIALRRATVNVNRTWAIDGAFKTGLAVAMIATAPVLG